LVRANLILLAACALLFLPVASASYTVTHLNVTISLNENTSAQVNEVLTVSMTNSSVVQYSVNRVALNLTLSNWQSIIGPSLVEHVINPGGSIYNFRFLPGPEVIANGNQSTAYILLSYTVNNVTTVNQTAPRTFVYSFKPEVFNFEHAASGEVLAPDTTLTIDLPDGAVVKSLYPLPDYPLSGFATNYAGVTSFSWMYGEPLEKFALAFVITESVQAEVANFFAGVYKTLGVFTYVIIAAVVLGFILYTYLKAGR
jgi:hypothetical protein